MMQPRVAPSEPVIVVGGDELALRVCEELLSRDAYAVTVLWKHAQELKEKFEALGAAFLGREPNDAESLRRAGVDSAVSILILSNDDHVTLHVALKARDLNPDIRIVLRQFNRTLGRKIEENLTNCSVFSLSAHSAATYAAAALDRGCFHGLQFPDIDGPLVGFSVRSIARGGVAGMKRRDAEHRLGARILAVDGRLEGDDDGLLPAGGRMVVFGPIASRPPDDVFDASQRRAATRSREFARNLMRGFARLDPLIKRAAAAALAIVAAATAYFSLVLKLDPLAALYYVVETITTTGYGDITPQAGGAPALAGAIALMLAGVTMTGIYIAILSGKVNEAQWVAVQGLRHVRRRGHVVVCGAGNVGSRVIDYLIASRLKVVVVEAHPKPEIVERSRDAHFDLLTGDATQDTTLDLCSLDHALALVALTNSDTNNLEVALGARARNPRLPIVMRCQEGDFANAIARHFGIDKTYATAALTAPAIADLARSPSARGRVVIEGRTFAIAERAPSELDVANQAGRVVLATWQRGEFRSAVRFEDAAAAERVLYLEPLAPR
ncbi:MAG: NAD-binding protein [Candidatus Eremiobacteraeota bacterium]|nr:NAD-binding protein [Candidatus Eremiobacteraeota bacterium]